MQTEHVMDSPVLFDQDVEGAIGPNGDLGDKGGRR